MQNENVKFKMEFNQRLIRLSLETIKLCQEIRRDRNLWAIADQLIRSATSIGANVIEAKSASSKLDYLKYFQTALKSANETRYWLILIRESSNNLKEQANKLLQEADEVRQDYRGRSSDDERQKMILYF
jgi:four helix bundle protein